MPFRQPLFWRIRLKDARKIHLTWSDEFGLPQLWTWCGKRYEADDRTYSVKSRRPQPGECRACLAAWNRLLSASAKIVRKAAPNLDEEQSKSVVRGTFE
jgi:hypothetical protein